MPKENNNIFLVFLILVFSTCFSSTTFSETSTKLSVRGSGQIIPRFETLKFNEVRLRKGPSRDHPIDWVYKLKGLPLKIISEFDDWRKVEDFDGVNGWIHRSQLSRKRVVQVISSNRGVESLIKTLKEKERKQLVVRGMSYLGVGHFSKEEYEKVIALKFFH